MIRILLHCYRCGLCGRDSTFGQVVRSSKLASLEEPPKCSCCSDTLTAECSVCGGNMRWLSTKDRTREFFLVLFVLVTGPVAGAFVVTPPSAGVAFGVAFSVAFLLLRRGLRGMER